MSATDNLTCSKLRNRSYKLRREKDMTLNVTEQTMQNKLVVFCEGRIDSTNANIFENKIVEIIDKGNNTLIIDFSKIAFVSSAGLRVLLIAAKKVKPYGGSVILSGLSNEVQEVFDISGFSSIFTIYKTVDEAVAKA